MCKFMKIFCLTIVLSVCVFAQTNSDEYKKNEYFVGYSNQQVDRGNFNTHHGFEGSYVRNVGRYFGIKGDVSGAYRKDSFNDSIVLTPGGTITNFRSESTNSLYNFLGGVQIKDNASKARLKPFGHALAGVAYNRSKYRTSINGAASQNFNSNQVGFAAALGGGLDVRVNDRFDIRAIQVDYNPVRNYGFFSNNFRLGFGIVFK